MEDDVEDFLAHFGVKGMRWGVRKERLPGVSRAVDHHARKDANEFARAKSYFGEGAGTRRKLISQTVEAKSSRMPGYKKAFEHHLANQDQAKHAVKAVSERHRTDRRSRNKQRGAALAREFTGERGTQAAIVAATIAGTAYLRSPKARMMMSNMRYRAIRLANSRQAANATRTAADFLRNNGYS